MSVKRYDNPQANTCSMWLADNGAYVLATDYDELLKLKDELQEALIRIYRAHGWIWVGDLLKKAEAFDASH